MQGLYVIYGDDAFSMAKELLEKIKPWNGFAKDARVVIKPNLVVAKPWTSGATTNPKLCEAVIQSFFERGYKNLIVAEGAWVGENTKRTFDVCGYTELCDIYGVELLDTKHDEFIIKSYKSYNFEISKTAIEADLIVNLPVIKGHCQTKITCSMKNLKGLISDKEKRRFHTMGLHEPIAYLNAVLPDVFTIADGIYGDLDFEEGGNPVQMDTMAASNDRVLLDSYAANLLSYDYREVGYIDIAHREGLGDIYNGNEICLNQPSVSEKLKRSHMVEKLRKYIYEDKACSACVGNLIRALDSVGYSKDDKICVGQGFMNKEVKYGVGRCANKDGKCMGCPPTSKQISEYLKNI